MKILFTVIACLSLALAVLAKALRTTQQAPERSLSAPTYYIAAEVYDCEPDPNYIDFRGASNLPSGAVVGALVIDLAEAKAYSEYAYVPVNGAGFFAGRIEPKQGMRFHHGLVLQVFFAPFRPKQAESVLRIIGKKGERLEEVANVSLTVPGDMVRPAVNPQLIMWSGDIYGLDTIASVPECGENQK